MHQVAGYELWLGHVGELRELTQLYKLGIEAVVDLAVNEPPTQLPREIAYCRFPLGDGVGNPPWLLRTAVETVASLLREGTPTFVYCGAGLSRTPAIAAAALAKVEGCPLREGLQRATAGTRADVSTALWADLEVLISTHA